MRRAWPTVAAIACLLCGGLAHAERATERYAPAQISVARDFLERARAAASLEEYASARTLAQQAALDARLAWGMTDAALLRAEAASIVGQAAALAARAVSPPPPPAVDLTTRSPVPAAASYRSLSGQAQAAAPSPR